MKRRKVSSLISDSVVLIKLSICVRLSASTRTMPCLWWRKKKSSRSLPTQSAKPLTQPSETHVGPSVESPTGAINAKQTKNSEPKDLWDRAYEFLREDGSTRPLLERYENIIVTELRGDEGSHTNSAVAEGFARQEQLATLVAQRLTIVEDSRWKIHMRSGDVEVRAQFDRIIKAVLLAKDFVSSAVSSEPHAALAWAGVCLLLPVSESFRKALVILSVCFHDRQ